MKNFVTKLALAIMFVFALGHDATAAEKIAVGVPNWPSAKVIANVLKVIIENDMGYEVELVPGSNEVIFNAMDRGKGDIDIHPDTWKPNHQHLHTAFVDEKNSVVLTNNPYHGTSRIFVPRYVADKYGVASIYDLTNPEIVKLFDSDGDGKGEMWIGATGWSSTNVERVRAREYGYDQLFDLTTIEEALAVADLKNAYEKEEPHILYFYSPHWLLQAYDLVALEEPPYDESCWTMVQPADDPEWFEKSAVSCAWPESSAFVAFSSRLREDAPDVAKFLERVELDDKLVSGWTYAVALEKRDAPDIAADWISGNRDRVDLWLGN